MKSWIMLPLAASVLAFAGVCQADDASVGLFAHDQPVMGDRVHEKGEDFVATWETDPISSPILLGTPSFYVMGAKNLQGKTDFAAVGLRWKFNVGKRLYFRPGVGLSVDDAPLKPEPGRIWAGTRYNFEPELSIGVNVTDRVAVEVTGMHMSMAYLWANRNPGINEIGLRTVIRFDRAALFRRLRGEQG